MFRTLAVAFVFWTFAGATLAAESSDPADTVRRFVGWYLAERPLGIPEAKARDALRPLATDALMRALDAAARGVECQQKASGGNEPPPYEGDLFTSLFEGATGADGVDAVSRTSTQAVYAVRWVYFDAASMQPPTRWKDRVMLKRVGGRWLIDDFRHDGAWAFAAKGSVTAILKSVAAECRK